MRLDPILCIVTLLLNSYDGSVTSSTRLTILWWQIWSARINPVRCAGTTASGGPKAAPRDPLTDHIIGSCK
jgi:hypothetical protein